jgi:hypothetical protein
MHAHKPAPDRAGAASPAAAAHVEEQLFVELVRSCLTVAEVAWATVRLVSLHLSTQPALTPPAAHVGLFAKQVKRINVTSGLTAYDYGSLEQDMALVAQLSSTRPAKL